MGTELFDDIAMEEELRHQLRVIVLATRRSPPARQRLYATLIGQERIRKLFESGELEAPLLTRLNIVESKLDEQREPNEDEDELRLLLNKCSERAGGVELTFELVLGFALYDHLAKVRESSAKVNHEYLQHVACCYALLAWQCSCLPKDTVAEEMLREWLLQHLAMAAVAEVAAIKRSHQLRKILDQDPCKE